MRFPWTLCLRAATALLLLALLSSQALAQGTTWVPIGLDGMNVNGIVVDPNDPLTVFAGTGGYGIFKTTDGGNSWVAVNTGISELGIFALVVDPSSSTTLYAGYAGAGCVCIGGVYKTTDGGGSWQTANNGLPSTFIWSLAIDPNNPQILYAGSYNPNAFSGSVSKTTNGGASWSTVLALGPTWTLAVDPLNSGTVYAGGAFGVTKSLDAGTSWQPVLGQAADALAIDTHQAGTLYAGVGGVGGVGGGVWKTTDGGATWQGPSLFDTRGMAIDPSNPTTLYAGTYPSGVFRSTDAGATWVLTNDGIPPPTNAFAFAIDPTNSTVYGGTTSGLFRLGNPPPSFSFSEVTPTPGALLKQNYDILPFKSVKGLLTKWENRGTLIDEAGIVARLASFSVTPVEHAATIASARPLDSDSIRIYLNGVDVTAYAFIENFGCAPSGDCSVRVHVKHYWFNRHVAVVVHAADDLGFSQDWTWSFDVKTTLFNRGDLIGIVGEIIDAIYRTVVGPVIDALQALFQPRYAY